VLVVGTVEVVVTGMVVEVCTGEVVVSPARGGARVEQVCPRRCMRQ
jgi:hypothetical protein